MSHSLRDLERQHTEAGYRFLDRQAEQQDRDEAMKEQKILDYIKEDYFTGEIVSETLPYTEVSWKIILKELEKHAQGQNADCTLVGRILLDSALDYISQNGVFE